METAITQLKCETRTTFIMHARVSHLVCPVLRTGSKLVVLQILHLTEVCNSSSQTIAKKN